MAAINRAYNSLYNKVRAQLQTMPDDRMYSKNEFLAVLDRAAQSKTDQPNAERKSPPWTVEDNRKISSNDPVIFPWVTGCKRHGSGKRGIVKNE